MPASVWLTSRPAGLQAGYCACQAISRPPLNERSRSRTSSLITKLLAALRIPDFRSTGAWQPALISLSRTIGPSKSPSIVEDAYPSRRSHPRPGRTVRCRAHSHAAGLTMGPRRSAATRQPPGTVHQTPTVRRPDPTESEPFASKRLDAATVLFAREPSAGAKYVELPSNRLIVFHNTIRASPPEAGPARFHSSPAVHRESLDVDVCGCWC